MKERQFTAEMLQKLKEANEAVKGTDEWMKYEMETYHKSSTTERFTNFSGFYIPYITGVIRTFRGQTFIYTDTHCGIESRYTVTPEVAALLGLEG